MMVVRSGGVDGCGPVGGGLPAPAPVAAPSPSVPASAAPRPDAAITPMEYPVRGVGRFVVAPDAGPVVGTRGRLLRYRIAVEVGITGITASQFASEVSQILDDPRSWTGTKQWRLQLVPAGARYDF